MATNRARIRTQIYYAYFRNILYEVWTMPLRWNEQRYPVVSKVCINYIYYTNLFVIDILIDV